MNAAAFLGALAGIVGGDHVLTAADARAGYEVDWTGLWRGECLAVARPGDGAQVAGVLRACAAHGVAVIPQGGNTGMVGGGVPRGERPQIVLSTRRLDAVEAVDEVAGQVTVGAGVTLERLQGLAASAGLAAGLDLGARAGATVGGLAACDAGGLQAVRYGTARRRIVGLEAVLPDGAVISRLSGLPKDNAGYDLPALLVGSEGTLCVFTRVRWSLVERQPARATALLALDSVAAAAAAAAALRRAVPTIEMLELIAEDAIRFVESRLGFPLPMPVSPAWVLVECAAASDPTDALAGALAELGLEDRATVAVDAGGRDRLLRLREELPEAVNRHGVSHKFDVGVPLPRLADFYGELRGLLRDGFPDGSLILYGHLGDGNVHVNVLDLEPEDEGFAAAVFALVAAHGGTVSAEHGVGAQKVRYLELTRSPGDIEAMGLIKRALDPAFMLNPGVILEAP